LKYINACKIIRVIDGDTIDVEIDLGFKLRTTQRIRLIGVDTPEMTGKDKVNGQHAKDFVQAWCLDNETDLEFDFLIETTKTDSFGRYLGDLRTIANESLTETLIYFEHGKRYEK